MTKRQARITIWTVMALMFLMAVMAPLTHLAGGASWSSLFSSGAKAAEPGKAAGISNALHPSIADPANIQPERAEEIYQSIRDNLRDHYARSGDPLFVAYQNWKRFTRLPYRSPNHGERFVNHYANDVAEAYKKYEKAGELPAGSIVIKDSFTVTGRGQVMTGPLFMMEKMPTGFRSLAGTWRFMMLRPDGTIVGLTGGVNENAVRFCAECHVKAGKDQDYLYFMPDEARLR
jgi:hypothetical protein